MLDISSNPPQEMHDANFCNSCGFVFDKARLFDALNALALLDAAKSDISLTELALSYRRDLACDIRLSHEKSSITVEQFFASYAARCAPEQKCSRDVSRSLGNIVAREVGPDLPMECLRLEDINAILGRYRSTVSWNSMARRLRAALRWGARESLVSDLELVEKIPLKPVFHREPPFFSPEQVERIMRIAVAHPGKARAGVGIALALGFFAGVRTVEIERARWEDIDEDGRVLRVPKPKGWTRGAKPRLVELEANTAAWIALWREWTRMQRRGAELRGLVVPNPRLFSEWKKRWLAPEGLSWGRSGGRIASATRNATQSTTTVTERSANIMRHTYATMHVAAFRNAATTALNLGHSGGTAILEKHYRGLISKQAAAKYWKIFP